MFKRLLGVIIIITAIIGLLIGIGGIIVGGQAIDGIANSVSETLPLVIDSLTTVEDSLVLAQDTVTQVNNGLDTVEQTTRSLSTSIGDAAPAMDQVVSLTGTDVPEGIEAFQASIPNLVNVAATIDSTLETLSNFKVETRILTFPLSFDLGIDYNPEAPFDQSIAMIGSSMEGVPEQIRALATELESTGGNLVVLSEDINTLAGNINDINTELKDIPDLLDRYIDIIAELETNLTQLDQNLAAQFDTLKLVITIIMIWFCMTQLAPFMVGWQLLFGNGNKSAETEADSLDGESDVVSYSSSEIDATDTASAVESADDNTMGELPESDEAADTVEKAPGEDTAT